MRTPPPIEPPAVIGILGGGQLGRMLGLAARAMGYRVAVLDPDTDCPAAAVADRLVIGSYDDVGAALRLADLSAVVTYELEHVAADVVETLAAVVPVRPGLGPLIVTQDRLAERRFVEGAGVAVAPWRDVRSVTEATAAARELGLPLRLKLPIGGYDGRGQLRIADADGARRRLGAAGSAGRIRAARREGARFRGGAVDRRRSRARWGGRRLPGRPEHPRRRDPRRVGRAGAHRARRGRACDRHRNDAWPRAMDLCGTLTAELFLLRDGSLVVNELAPRVHNSGHWTIEGAATSQFEQHIRAICGLGLGSPEALTATAMVNLLGSGRLRDARLVGVPSALADPTVHLHLYDKRRVFERRKMGHLTATAADVDGALDRARQALALLSWADDTMEGDR